MSSEIRLELESTFSALFAGKMHRWARRSLPRYFFLSLAMSYLLPFAFPSLGGMGIRETFPRVFGPILVVSLLSIAGSAQYFARRFAAKRVTLVLTEECIIGMTHLGEVQKFPWTSLGRVQETQAYFYIPESNILKTLLKSKRIARTGFLFLSKDTLQKRGILEACRQRLEQKGLLISNPGK